MENEMELQQMIYNILTTQIEFGVYRFEARLPTIEETGQLLFVSADTVRSAYLRLKQEGYISLSRSVGAHVKVCYDADDIALHIQNFYSLRKNALIELSRSMRPLFGKAQWLGFRKAPPELLDRIEALAARTDILPPYRMLRHLQMIYGSLENELLMRLVYQIFIFFQAPFLSIAAPSIKYKGDDALLSMIRLCRQKDWDALRSSVEDFQAQLSCALCRFYDETITASVPEDRQIPFQWTSYKKASQRCYSLGMELMVAINRGIYSTGSFLPSLQKLAKEKQVSVSTVRRTLALLNSIGVTKSINGLGTQILPKEEISKNCVLTPVLRRRLVDYAQSMQIIALSCREVSAVIAGSLNSADVDSIIEHLRLLKRLGRQELAAYGIIELFTHLAPCRIIRDIYTELFQQLLWGYPLRGMHTYESHYANCLSYLDIFIECLEQSNIESLSSHLEEFICSELSFSLEMLESVGITEVSSLSLIDLNKTG